MVDWNVKFKWQYDYAKDWINNSSKFSAEWQPTIASLQRLMQPGGFAVSEAKALKDVRKRSEKAAGKAVDQATGLLAAVNAGGNNAPAIPEEAKLSSSALKFLAHTYLLSHSGKKKMWLHSSPKVFQHWPSVHMNGVTAKGEIKRLLNSKREQFTQADKKNIASCATKSLHWVQKTNLTLGHANRHGSWAREQVKKWFADPSVTEAQLDDYIKTLSRGFKQITATLNKGSMILTDFMGLRAQSTAEEIEFINAEAFTWPSHSEGLDVIYIEKAFFKNSPGNVLPGSANWARILIHELTHLCCGTKDIVNGQARYAHYGIGPHAGYPGSQCIENADNWAFFAVDCGGGMTDAQAKHALKII